MNRSCPGKLSTEGFHSPRLYLVSLLLPSTAQPIKVSSPDHQIKTSIYQTWLTKEFLKLIISFTIRRKIDFKNARPINEMQFSTQFTFNCGALSHFCQGKRNQKSQGGIEKGKSSGIQCFMSFLEPEFC